MAKILGESRKQRGAGVYEKMKSKGKDISEIIELTGLTKEEVEKL